MCPVSSVVLSISDTIKKKEKISRKYRLVEELPGATTVPSNAD
jgi:hypothetical protein